MNEVLDYYQPKISESTILKELKISKKEYLVASFHREENVDNHENLEKIITVLKKLSANIMCR